MIAGSIECGYAKSDRRTNVPSSDTEGKPKAPVIRRSLSVSIAALEPRRRYFMIHGMGDIPVGTRIVLRGSLVDMLSRAAQMKIRCSCREIPCKLCSNSLF
jgi:hypothetical protein